MSTAAEKRFYAAKLAAKFHGTNSINERSQEDNRGDQLEGFLRPVIDAKIWSPGTFWCAAYVSAISLYTDRDLPTGPMSKFRSALAIHQAAGVFSKNHEEAYPGLAVSWHGDGGGHVGIVVSVDYVKGIVVVSEGNTSAKSGDRNGTTTKLKSYYLYKNKPVKNLSWIGRPGSKGFFAYSKIWEEDDYSIRGSHTPKPVMLASNDYDQYSSPKSDNQTRGATSTTQNNQNTKQAAQQDYSNLFLFSSGNIMNVGEQQELSKPITQTSDSKKSEGAIPIDKQNISLT